VRSIFGSNLIPGFTENTNLSVSVFQDLIQERTVRKEGATKRSKLHVTPI